MASINWDDARPAKGVLLDSSEASLLNSLSGIQNSWDIVLGNKVVCKIQRVDEIQSRPSSIYLYFQCGSEVLKIGLDSMGILWLHPILRDVPFGFEIPETLIAPILEQLLLPLSRRLQRVLHTQVRFLGHFYELGETGAVASIHFILHNTQLSMHKKDSGLSTGYTHVTCYVPSKGNNMLALRGYLSNHSKRRNIFVDTLPLDMWVRAGHCTLTIKQLESIRVGDTLIPSAYPLLYGRAWLVFLGCELPCVIEHGVAKVMDFQGIGTAPEKIIESWGCEEIKGLPISQIKNSLFVPISFDIAQEHVTVKELSQVKPGYTLKVNVSNQRIALRNQERTFALGEFIEINSIIGIKITEILW